MLPWIALCLVACAGLVFFERAELAWGTWISKPLAAVAYIGAAVAAGALESGYGRWVLLALGFSWLGDVLLIPKDRPNVFVAGIASFLLAQLTFGLAFWVRGVSPSALGLFGLACAGGAILLLRWLRPHLQGVFRWAVPAYIIVIAAMVALAGSAAVAAGPVGIAIGALMFAVSDVAVARDRLVEHGSRNAVWGLPLYFGAQLVLAGTVASAVVT